MLFATIESISNSDSRQFMTQIYQKYHRLVYHIAQKWISDDEELKDVVQVVWANLVGKEQVLLTLDERKEVSYVVYTTRNTALKHLDQKRKDRNRLVNIDIAEMDESVFADFSSPEETVVTMEWQRAFQKVWSTLPERERLLLEGKYLFGQNDEELAECLGCKPSSVRMALTRARRMAMNEFARRRNDESPETAFGAV